jgi:hypothetical protein
MDTCPQPGSRRLKADRSQAGAPVAITRESVEAIAVRVAELLQGQADSTRRFVDARELAGILGISRSTVYERACELGAIRLGNGARARLRFDVVEATAGLRTRDQPAARAPGRRRTSSPRRRRRVAGGDLLPIREEVRHEHMRVAREGERSPRRSR